MSSLPGPSQIRSLYRRILRELPPRPFNSERSPLRTSIRDHFTSDPASLSRQQEAEQYVQYLRAQRLYNTLLERYNPSLTMEDEDRTRLTARRVGMEMPVEFKDLLKDFNKKG